MGSKTPMETVVFFTRSDRPSRAIWGRFSVKPPNLIVHKKRRLSRPATLVTGRASRGDPYRPAFETQTVIALGKKPSQDSHGISSAALRAESSKAGQCADTRPPRRCPRPLGRRVSAGGRPVTGTGVVRGTSSPDDERLGEARAMRRGIPWQTEPRAAGRCAAPARGSSGRGCGRPSASPRPIQARVTFTAVPVATRNSIDFPPPEISL